MRSRIQDSMRKASITRKILGCDEEKETRSSAPRHHAPRRGRHFHTVKDKIRQFDKGDAGDNADCQRHGVRYKLVGLDSGADDYVAKPFGTMELISRIKALLRRSGMNNDPVEYRKGALYLCPSKHIVKVDGKDVTLTFKEFELLCLLFRNEGIVLTRDEILSKIWGYEFDGENRTVDVHIRTLRSKLGEAGSLIRTVRGLGYKIGGSDE